MAGQKAAKEAEDFNEVRGKSNAELSTVAQHRRHSGGGCCAPELLELRH